MNPTLELIEKRRSVRLYDPTPLTGQEKEAIINATLRAPTAGAMMLYSIIEVNDPQKKEKLAETCDRQPFIASTPYLLLFLADFQRWMDLYEAADCEARAADLNILPRLPGEGDLLLAMMDAMIAAQTAVLAAQSLGIGSCYIGDIMENWEIHQAMFDLPRYTIPAVLVCFGRPGKTLPGARSPRFEPRFIVHQDRYRRFSRSELDEMNLPFGKRSFEQHEYPNGALNIVQANYIRKFATDFSIEMNRSAREMLKTWGSSG